MWLHVLFIHCCGFFFTMLVTMLVCIFFFRWRYNNWEIDPLNPQYTTQYSMIGGNLVISNPQKSRDLGKYVCIVSNEYGTIRSNEASLKFGCKYY